MKKISLSEVLKNDAFIESTEEAIRKINGGCTVKVGCNTSSYFFVSYVNKCSSNITILAKHKLAAVSYAAAKVKKPGNYKVTGTKDPYQVQFLG